LKELPYLMNFCSAVNQDYKTYFASYWLYVGVPFENEGEAIDLLFQFIVSPKTNITTKSRAVLVLFNLTKKYPELKNEFRYSLKDQLNKYSKDFDKRITKILMLIEQ